MQDICVNDALLNQQDMRSLDKYIEWCEMNKHLFHLEGGKEHYKLLACIASQLSNAKIVDIGTYYGFSAAALSINDSNTVLSYDIFDWIPDDVTSIKQKPNVEMRLTDCTNDVMDLLDAELICLDVSPHDGEQEMQIYSLLAKYKYKGILYINNVNVNQDMKAFVQQIKHKNVDVTKYGHFTGSSLIVFDTSKYNILVD